MSPWYRLHKVGQQLILIEFKIVGFFKCRKRVGSSDKFSEAASLNVPTRFGDMPRSASEVSLSFSATSLRTAIVQVLLAELGQPDEVIFLGIQLFDFVVPIFGIFPRRIVFFLKEDAPLPVYSG